MPFDAAGFPARNEPPKRRHPGDALVTVVIVMMTIGLLLIPISLNALVDMVRYAQSF